MLNKMLNTFYLSSFRGFSNLLA